MPASLGGFSANHCAMEGMCDSNEPGIERLSTPARVSPRFSKSWVTPPGTRMNEPRVAWVHASPTRDTHGAFDDVKDVVLGVRMRARTLRMWLKPPFRDRVARFAFGFVRLEDRGDAAHRIGTSLPGTENHSFAS